MYDSITPLSRVQVNGQVTIPNELRKLYDLKEGDLVSFVATEEGILIAPQEVIISEKLNTIGDVLKENRVQLDELIESGRDIRETLVEEKHTLKSTP